MKKTNLVILTFVVITTWSCGPPPSEEPLPMKVAKAYGFDNFEDIQSISYTWNVQADPETVRTRAWKWNIKERTVYYADKDTSYTYSLDLPKEEMPKADGGFVNDKYWLMYPFQLAWDTGYSYEVLENVPAPISGENSTKLTVVYNDEDGYTPGDAYDLYLNDSHMIREWVFRRGNGPEGRAMTWENEQDFKGIKLATEHKNDAGIKFIWFTDIQVE